MLKRFGLWLLAAFFTFCILSVAVLTATNAVFGSPDALKDSFAESGVYDSAAEGIVDQVVESTQKPPEDEKSQQRGDDLQLDPKLARKVATKVVTPDKLQVYAEQIVDGTYNWLEGEVDQPDYNIDTSSIKKDLGVAVGDTAVERLESLPVCTTQQLLQLQASGEELDPFNVPCRPPGLNLQAERTKLVNEIVKSDELLEDTKINAEDTKSEETGETPFEKLAFVPTIFQWSKVWPWILGVLGLVTAAGMVFWQEDRRKGMKKVAKILLVSGVLLLIGIAVVSFLFSRAGLQPEEVEETRLQQAIFDVVRSLSAAFNRTLLVFAITYTVLGIGGLLWLRFTKPKGTVDSHDSPEEKPSEPKADANGSAKEKDAK